MNWNELLQNLLYVAITAILPLVVTYVVTYIKAKTNEISNNISNETMKTYAQSASNAVSNAVLEVMQTYVSSLKDQGAFTAETGQIAKEKAVAIATTLITDNAKSAIETMYGDFNTWMNSEIERLVLETKSGYTTLTTIN